jgi:hypothetical protein
MLNPAPTISKIYQTNFPLKIIRENFWVRSSWVKKTQDRFASHVHPGVMCARTETSVTNVWTDFGLTAEDARLAYQIAKFAKEPTTALTASQNSSGTSTKSRR